MKKIIILPTQLFDNIRLLKNKSIYLIEEPFYFTRFKFHKLKIAYHRATMKKYYQYLKDKKFQVDYIEFKDVEKFYKEHKKSDMEMYHPVDIPILKLLKQKFINLMIHPTLNFTFSHLELENVKNNLSNSNKQRYNHKSFYKYQRNRMNILMENGKPIGGKYSFDTENRNKFPKDVPIPELPKIKIDKFVKEAIDYTKKHFPNNYGSLDYFIYPISHESSIKWLNDFLQNRLGKFGDFQDAISSDIDFGFHSVLTPMMNVGLLTDMEVISLSEKYYKNNTITLNNYEGFIRQIIGWRNYMYYVYLLENENLTKGNYFNNTKKIGTEFWEATTGILPVDNAIKKIVKYAYVHHIERLMILGNYLLIKMKHPDEVYRIFMEWTIDSYDWVMLPNVYSMSQYSNSMMTTRPYFSSSNYIIKLSNYKKDSSRTEEKNKWSEKWNSQYRDFIKNNIPKLQSNYATSHQVKHYMKYKKMNKN